MTPVQDEEEMLILKNTVLVSEVKDHISQRLIIASCLEEVWLMYNVDARCRLGKARHKWGHVMCVSIMT